MRPFETSLSDHVPTWPRLGASSIALLCALLAWTASAEEASAPATACAAICEMESVCKTLDVDEEKEREPFCLSNCRAPAFDPAFRGCLAGASGCEAFSSCVETFSRARESLSPATRAVTGLLEVGASLPTTPCSGTPNGCTYPEVCCTQIWGAGNRSHRQRVCGEYHCPSWCALGLNPWCAWCGCPRKHDVYPNWPPAPAQQLALRAYGDDLVLAYRPYQIGDSLNVTLSSNGEDFDDGEAIDGIASRLGPSLTPFKGRLALAYRKHHDDEIQVVFSDEDGKTFRPLYVHPGKPMGSVPGARSRHPPAVAAFQDQLHVFFVARHESAPLYRVSTTDGTGLKWTQPIPVGDLESPTQPAAAVFRNQLFLAYPSQDGDGRLVVASTDDLERWGRVSWPAKTTHAPALAVFEHRLVVAYNDDHDLVTVTSSDGVEFVDRSTIPGQSTSGEVALATFGSRLYLAYKANDSSNTLWVTSTADGESWDQKVHLPNQTTP